MAKDALLWAGDIAQAMHYLHAVCRPSIVHRDLKVRAVYIGCMDCIGCIKCVVMYAQKWAA